MLSLLEMSPSDKRVIFTLMLILLPPSEKKRTPESGEVLELSTLSFANELTFRRKKLLTANHHSLPTAEAMSIYSGVLYQALGWEEMSHNAHERGRESLVIISALFGALRVYDKIPIYKEKISVRNWKEPVSAALSSIKTQLIVDCRSSNYLGVWNPDPRKTVSIRVFSELNGTKKVITHLSKKTRGEVARALLQLNTSPKSPQQLQESLSKEFSCELIAGSEKQSWKLDITVL
jgi:uncharacterized protein